MTSVDHFNEKKSRSKETLLQRIRDIVAEHLSCFDVHIYGSYATGFSLPSGDIDIVLEPNSFYPTSKHRYNDPLELIHSILETQQKPLTEEESKMTWVHKIKFLKSATIPVIKIEASEEYDSVAIDITITGPNHHGLDCTT